MPQNLPWLFFDIGYTLVSEDPAQNKRIWDVIENEKLRGRTLTYDAIYNEIIRASKDFCQPFPTALKRLGISDKPVYPKELEVPYEDAAAALATLKKRYHIGVIANQLAGAAGRLEGFGLLPYIEVLVSSAEAGVSKPDARIFELALSRAGCPPENACMIGDRLDNDIYPAKKLGMKTIRVKQGFGGVQVAASAEYEADFTVSSLSELPGIL